jgi:16S rRNA (guanine527-N7)-methyltransferase
VTPLERAIEVLIGRAPKAVERTRFERYLRLLVEWNRTHRLTAIRSAEGIVADLFVDSLLFLSCLPPGAIKMADLGTGPGIPGVPLRIVRDDIALTLVESKRKRVSFLAGLKRELELSDLSILEGRAEELVKARSDLTGTFDVVVVRAVGASILPIAMTYLRPGGLFLAGGPPGGAGKSDPSGMRWQTKAFNKLGLKRTFLLSQKPS